VIDAITARARARTCPEDGPDAVLDRCATLVEQLSVQGHQPVGVGVGSCGLVDQHGVVLETTDTMPGWAGVDIPTELARRCGVPCRADNDGNAAALGEAICGAGRGHRLVMILTLGTGVVLDGEILHGAGSMAGSFGHTKVTRGGARCACGARGCLEAYASAWAFRQALDMDAAEVFAMATDGDRRAQRLVDQAAWALGTALANIANGLNPDVIAIGGGLAKAWEQLVAPALSTYEASALRTAFHSTKVVPAQLGEDAGILGAAILGARALAER
jgi:glucokinase